MRFLFRKHNILKLFGKCRFRKSIWTRPAVENSLSDVTELISKLQYFCAIYFKFGYRTSLRQKTRGSDSLDILGDLRYLSSSSL